MAKSINPKIIIDKDVDRSKVSISLRRDNSNESHWRPIMFNITGSVIDNTESHSPAFFRYPTGENNWSEKIVVSTLKGCDIELTYIDDTTIVITKDTKEFTVGLPVKIIHIVNE